jgi:hypothetical protein
MKQLSFFILLVLFIGGCKNTDSHKQTIKPISNEIFTADTQDSTLSTKAILAKYTPSILAHTRADTSLFYYGNYFIEYDTVSRHLLVGKFLDKSKVIATEVNLKDTIINFYTFDQLEWKLVGSEKTRIPIYTIEFDDLDGDNQNEIITSTGPNMNGNSWKEVYYCSANQNTVKFAGSFSTDFEVNKDKKTIQETYEGSWYMDASQTLYQWQQHKLIPLKMVVRGLKTKEYESEEQFIEYYENPTKTLNGLRLITRETFHDSSKRQNALWDNFFSTQ